MTIFNKIFNRRKQAIETTKLFTYKVIGISYAGTPIEMFVTAENETRARKIAMGTDGIDSRAFTTDHKGNWHTCFKGIYHVKKV